MLEWSDEVGTVIGAGVANLLAGIWKGLKIGAGGIAAGITYGVLGNPDVEGKDWTDESTNSTGKEVQKGNAVSKDLQQKEESPIGTEQGVQSGSVSSGAADPGGNGPKKDDNKKQDDRNTEYRYTKHASDRMLRDKIHKSMVEETIKNGQKFYDSLKKTLVYWKEGLSVVTNMAKDTIVTTFKDSKGITNLERFIKIE